MHNCLHEITQTKFCRKFSQWTWNSFLRLYSAIKRLRIPTYGNHLTLHSIRRNIASHMLSGTVFLKHTHIPGRIPSSFSWEGVPDWWREAVSSRRVFSHGAPVFFCPVSSHLFLSWAVLSSSCETLSLSLFLCGWTDERGRFSYQRYLFLISQSPVNKLRELFSWILSPKLQVFKEFLTSFCFSEIRKMIKTRTLSALEC